MAWGDRPGRIDMGSYTLSPAPDSARSTDTSQFGICDPTYSPFSLSPSHKHRSRSIYPYTPFSTQFLFSSFTFSFFPSVFLSHSLATFLASSNSSDAPHCYLILSVPFPHHILAPFPLTNPTCMRLFPHVVLIIYTFSIFRLFFFSSLPIRQARLSSQPLIHLYARRCIRRFPVCLTLSLSFTPFRA
ncbi:hypothetical protein EDB85DRAFT_1910389 [Lactarius pseudohatsudake]|nr:hypothetical protein EDB85DRAFT_1910389 [Lactarius pseudohatsudake]